MPTLIHQRVRECQQGTYLKLIYRVRSGWVVMGDVQFLKGYCLLLPDPVVANLNELNEQGRKTFLWEMSVVGDVILEVTGALRVNYEMIGNVEPALHAHIFPRYEDEPDNLKLKPAWFYDWETARAFDKSEDSELMQSIAAGLKAKGL
ncbi:MAG: diadenosine tetraphosphate (Ap4A) HIT family hydrolase [Pseudohongiellaceae bacterium]|jgi:diadenosine tetraphosphate (Ap4A) HIT family hydrolase